MDIFNGIFKKMEMSFTKSHKIEIDIRYNMDTFGVML